VNETPNELERTLRRARDLIADRACWTRHAQARDASGCSVDPTSDQAVCFCAIGAVMRYAPDDRSCQRALYTLAEAASAMLGNSWGSPQDEEEVTSLVTNINDAFGWEAVLRVFDRALRATDGAA
jgi:hypothetical protein